MLPAKFYEVVEAVLYVALHSGGKAVRSAEICQYKQVPARHFEHIMQLLVKHEILKGTTGPKGGYTLAKEKRKLTLSDLLQMYLQSVPSYQATTSIAKSLQHRIATQVEPKIIEALQHITLEDLCKELEEQLKDERSLQQKADFNI